MNTGLAARALDGGCGHGPKSMVFDARSEASSCTGAVGDLTGHAAVSRAALDQWPQAGHFQRRFAGPSSTRNGLTPFPQ